MICNELDINFNLKRIRKWSRLYLTICPHVLSQKRTVYVKNRVRYKLSGRKFDHWKQQQIENGRRKFQ